jgi:neutral ceramidase
MHFPFEWQPRIVSTQLALIGSVAIACVPGEFTTMSGRRLRDAVTEGVAATHVIVAGLCNTYSDYITTPEEYEVQVSRRFTTHRHESESLSLKSRPWVGR